MKPIPYKTAFFLLTCKADQGKNSSGCRFFNRSNSQPLISWLNIGYNLVTIKGADSMKIIPIRDLKNTVEVERLCAEENGPVFVTKNGYGRLVVMDIDYYEKTMRKMDEATTILDGLKDVKSGNTVEGDTAISNIRNKYSI